MGLFDELKRLAHPYEDELDDEYDDDLMDDEPEPYVEPKKEKYREREVSYRDREPSYRDRESSYRDREATSIYSPSSDLDRRSNKVVNIHTTTQLQVVLVKPDRFENASDIADHLRDKRTVVLNLESTRKDIARRLLDFLSGVAYANEGKIKKVALSTYIITPYNVDILGDLIDELENNGLYF